VVQALQQAVDGLVRSGELQQFFTRANVAWQGP
jgi:hypothetical protein